MICDSHSQDGCATLGSTGGARLYQASILGDFQRRVSYQTILNLAPFGGIPCGTLPPPLMHYLHKPWRVDQAVLL